MLLRKLCDVAFGYHYHGIVIALKAFIDGSGKEATDGVITVGGYFARDDTCDWIEEEWQKAIHSEGIEVFHLADFGTEHCPYGTGRWSLDRRISFLKRLAGVINQPSIWFASISAETKAHTELLRTSALQSIYGPAYSWCAQMCFALIEQLMLRGGILGERMAYAFENGDRQHELLMAFQEYERANPELETKRSISFIPKSTPLMQPADLIAGKTQEVLLRAHSRLGFLDNGRGLTHISTFRKYYSTDGTSAALLQSPEGPLFPRFCYVGNSVLREENERKLFSLICERPSILLKREKARINQGKRRRPKGQKIVP